MPLYTWLAVRAFLLDSGVPQPRLVLVTPPVSLDGWGHRSSSWVASIPNLKWINLRVSGWLASQEFESISREVQSLIQNPQKCCATTARRILHSNMSCGILYKVHPNIACSNNHDKETRPLQLNIEPENESNWWTESCLVVICLGLFYKWSC